MRRGQSSLPSLVTSLSIAALSFSAWPHDPVTRGVRLTTTFVAEFNQTALPDGAGGRCALPA